MLNYILISSLSFVISTTTINNNLSLYNLIYLKKINSIKVSKENFLIFFI